MLSVPLTLMDLIVITILLISGALAFFRGFVHEVLSIGGWVGAGFAAWYGYDHPALQSVIRDVIPVTWAAYAVGAVGIFLVTLALLSIVTSAVARRVRSHCLNSLDRALGFLFDWFVRGLLSLLSFGSHLWCIQNQKAARTGSRRPAHCLSSKPVLKLSKPPFLKVLKPRVIKYDRLLRPAKIKLRKLLLSKSYMTNCCARNLQRWEARWALLLSHLRSPRDMIRCQTTVLTSSFKSNNLLPHQAKVRNLGFSSPLTPLRGCT